MVAPFTRLVNIQTGEAKPISFLEMPTYLAVSHTWADELFPPGIPFSACRGRIAVLRLLELEAYHEITYCWIDTISIDQNDEGDKHRQIPLMGQIYGGAAVVLIVVKDHLGLTQRKIDRVLSRVQEAVQMSQTGSWLKNGHEWASSEKKRRHLKDAMDILTIFVGPAWSSRVWTMQEYILAKETLWIGGDLQTLKVDGLFFQAVPDVCDYLSIEECLIPKYAKLYSHFQGMAGAHLKLIDPTRVMELLGNRIATVPEDEVYGLMSASGVILSDASTTGKENVWARWWEKAIQDGNLRWALLPPASIPSPPIPVSLSRNCVMPEYHVRHLCSTNSCLDTVVPYGSFKVDHGTLSTTARLGGQCRVLRKLGRMYLDTSGEIARDITLCLFASNNPAVASKIASAFGAGRYNIKQRAMIAETLVLNYYRAKLAVMTKKISSFMPQLISNEQATVWSDFMLLQSVHMRVMNDGTAFLAKISNSLTSTYCVIVTSSKTPSGDLLAIDCGAVNESEKSMFMIVRPPSASLLQRDITRTPPSFHKEGVAMYMQVTDSRREAARHASHMLERPENFQTYRIGGAACAVCQSPEEETTKEEIRARDGIHIQGTMDPGILRYTHMQMLGQDREIQRLWKERRRKGTIVL